MGSLLSLEEELQSLVNPQKAKILERFFKTGKGEYGEDDKFLGVIVPEIRKLVKKYRGLDLLEIDKLLHSQFHEERLLGLLILVEQFNKAEQKTQEKIFNYYLANTQYINNWDLVDLTAPKIVGQYVLLYYDNSTKAESVIYRLARSTSLWERRIAIISTFIFIRNNNFSETLKISELLLADSHDLIHKAVGWMLREVGKRNLEVEEEFLKKYAKAMPKTMLRYAVEKWDLQKKKSLIQWINAEEKN